MPSIQLSKSKHNTNFDLALKPFLDNAALPFGNVLPPDTIESVMRKFDSYSDAPIFCTVIVLWAFLSQVLGGEKSKSCSSAVSRIINYFIMLGKNPPTTDTGDYCVARAKLKANAIRELAITVAKNTEYLANKDWLWNDRHAKLVDGFTLTMPDTPQNQKAYPQVKSQKEGCGFPIMRAVAVLSLSTAMICDADFCAYSGKKTGESALLRKLLMSFDESDIAVFDRLYCSYMTIAQFQQSKVDVCTRLHQSRNVKFSRKKRIGKNDYLVTWDRPIRPEWMNEEEYGNIPKEMTLRIITYTIKRKGCRSEKITVVTTLLDAETYDSESIAELYGLRWNVELDIRHIKCNLGLDHMRCQSPEMIANEFWINMLGYNLVRRTICEASNFSNCLPRKISFTQACAYLLTSWETLSLFDLDIKKYEQMLKVISKLKIRSKKGRIEPRVIKRRRNSYPRMQKPRKELRQEIISGVCEQ